MPWMLRAPRIRIEGYDEIGPFDTWGKAKSESMHKHYYPNLTPEILEVPDK